MMATKPMAIRTLYGVSAGKNDASAGPGRRGHRHRQDVIGEQRDTGDLCREQPEVVAGDHVGPAGRRVLLDGLPVGEDQHEEHETHRDRDGHDQREGQHADHRHQHVEDLFGRVRDGRDVVRREHCEAGRNAEAFVFEGGVIEGRTEDLALEAVRPRLG